MNNSAKLLLFVLLAAGLGTGVFFFLNNNQRSVVEPDNPGPGPAEIQRPKGPDLKGDTGERRTPTKPEIVRSRIENQMPSGKEFKQGVSGRVINEQQLPVAGAKVFLVRGTDVDFMRMYLEYQKGVRFPPVAQTETDQEGRYRLGLEEPKDGKKHEIYVVHEDYFDQKIPNIEIQPESWQPFDDVVMKRGAQIFGLVTSEQQGLPLQGITVVAQQEHGQFSMVSVPGREAGFSAETDPRGQFTLPRLDPALAYKVSVSAPRFAKETKTGVRFSGKDRQQVDFRLAPGLEIGGQVLNSDGQPIPNASITVGAISRTSQYQEKFQADKEGRFLASNLKAGPYTIIAEAMGYQRAEEKPIQAGDHEVVMQMERQGAVIVTVVDNQNRPLANYHANLKAAFKGQQGYGRALQQVPVKGASDGRKRIEGIDPGNYAVEIYAKGFAKNFSATFVVGESTEQASEVTVRMSRGGAIKGRLLDDLGKPVAGATIITRPNKFFDNPFVRMFNPPFTVSRSTVKSARDGSFEVKLLFSFAYQLHITHPTYCSTSVNDIMVKDELTTDTGTIQMFRGCVISGLATVDGKPTGQVKVMVSAAQDPQNQQVQQHFSAEAISDHEGKFLIQKRLPPGRYEIMAGRQTQANPLISIIEMNASKQKFSVNQGELGRQIDINIQSQN